MLVKPDGVTRGLVGEIISRVEKSGLKLVGLKMLKISREHAHTHQPNTEEWYKGIGGKTLESYEKYGRNAKKEIGTDDALKIGKMVAEWNIDFLTSGPIVSMVWEGNHAIDAVRKIVGSTMPIFSPPGTIRGDFAKDSPALANAMKRSIRNLVHASGDPKEAAHEIDHWFSPNEINTYERIDWAAMFGEIKGS